MNIRSFFLTAFALHTLLKPRPSGSPSLGWAKTKLFLLNPEMVLRAGVLFARVVVSSASAASCLSQGNVGSSSSKTAAAAKQQQQQQSA
jgi:hypothetical protein